MAVHATHVRTGTQIVISRAADLVSEAILQDVYGRCGPGVLECREHDNDPRLAHLRDPDDGLVHRAWVYVQKRRDRWVICHLPSNRDELKLPAHHVPRMTDQHRWQADYWARAGSFAGYTAAQEVTIPSGNVVDVAITGPIGTVGVEVQHSDESSPAIVKRDKKARGVKVPLIWSADRRHVPWAYRVAHVETQELPHSHVPRNSWTVVAGPRRIRPERCTPEHFTKCWLPRRRKHCGSWHPVFDPYTGLTVDRVAELVPAGELLRLNTGISRGVILISPQDMQLWESEFAPQMRGLAPERDNKSSANWCSYGRAAEQVATAIDSPLAVPDPRGVARPCQGCGQLKYGIADGRCLLCRSEI